MSQGKSDRFAPAITVGLLAFIVMGLIHTKDSKISNLRSQQRQLMESKLKTDPPDNLLLAADTFQEKVHMEARDFPAEKMGQLKAWKELQRTLLAYSYQLRLLNARIKLLETQDAELDHQLQQRMHLTGRIRLAWIIGMLGLSLWYYIRQKKSFYSAAGMDNGEK
jgi:hypothetical protein